MFSFSLTTCGLDVVDVLETRSDVAYDVVAARPAQHGMLSVETVVLAGPRNIYGKFQFYSTPHD
jgi:hypothetical protein